MRTLAIPLHLAVHVLGLTVASGLAVFAVVRRRDAGPAWPGLLVGSLLIGLTHIVTGALVGVDSTWPIYARAAGYAGVAVAAAGGLVGGIGVVALAAPVSAHWAAGAAGLAAAFAARRGTLGSDAEALPLVGGLAAWAIADVVIRSTATGAAALSLLGSGLIGLWLLRHSRRSLLARFVAAFVSVLLLLVVGLAAAGGVLFTTDLRSDEVRQLQSQVDARADDVSQAWPAELQTLASTLGGETTARALAGEPGAAPANLDGLAAGIGGIPGVDIVVLIAADGRVFGSFDAVTQAPLPLGDEPLIAGSDVVQQGLKGARRTRGTVALGTGDLLAVGAVLVAPDGPDGAPQFDRASGVLALGRRITSVGFVQQVAAQTGTAATIIVGATAAATTLDDVSAVQLADAVARRSGSTATLDGDPVFYAVAPLVTTDGSSEGWLVLSSSAGRLAAVEDAFTRSVFWVAAFGVLLAGLLAAWASRRTTGPVTELTRAAERVAGGDLDTRVSIDRVDEVGRLAQAFDVMTGSLSEQQASLRSAAATESELRGRLEVLTSSIGEALISVDAAGIVQTVNPATSRLLDRPARSLIGRPINEVMVGFDASGATLLELLGDPLETRPASARAAVGEGRRRTPVAGTAAPLLGEDGPIGRVYVLRDIAGEVEVERMKTEFLSNISHELRTPLTPIKGYSEVLRVKDVGRERTIDFATSIATSAKRLERIIGMLVDFAALEAGRMEVNLAPTALRPVVDQVLVAIAELHPGRKVTRRLQRGIPEVQVDQGLLGRVLVELVDNALKFSEGPVSVTAVREGDNVRLTVRDRGDGIAPEDLAEIGRDFHQGDGSATRRHGGLGLGLSIVSRILDGFGADLRVESEVDVGTQMHAVIPIARTSPAKRAS